MAANDSRPVVSIGLPFLSPGSLVVEAVQSIFAQTSTDWELIAVDDGSTDRSADLLRRIDDPRVKLISDGHNLGLPTRLNQIAEMSSGKYLARMDADDIMHPDRLERQVRFLETHPNLDVVATGCFVLDCEGNVVGVRIGTKPSHHDVFKWGGYLHPSILAKREWFLCNKYSANYPRAEDRELFVRTASSSTFAVIRDPLYYYRYVGKLRLDASMQSYASERAVLLRYGLSDIGLCKTFGLMVRSYLKSMVLILLARLRKEQLITKRHFSPIQWDDLQQASKVLAFVRAQRVPGWEH